MVELMRDTALALAPVSVPQAKALLARLKGYPLLTGFRGSVPVDIDALADAIARISELGADNASRIRELDVNPIIVRPDGVLAVDALISC
jgi:acetate---CoA ligase (ADP-forming)